MKRVFLSALSTTAFRTAAISALIYAVLTGLLIAAVYPQVSAQLQAQISTGIQAESTALASLYDTRGTATLVRIIHTRSNAVLPDNDADADDPGRRYYALADSDNKIRAGDLHHWPADLPSGGWVRFRFRHQTVRALITRLPNGDKLLVGQSLAISDALGKQSLMLVVLGALVALLFGLAGGILIGARVMRRIKDSSATAARIQQGHLEERLATGGAGEHDSLARAFNAMLDRIETTVLSLRDLSARTAHEIRHPLTRMEQVLSQAEQADSLDKARTAIQGAHAQIGELVRRTDAVLRLARLESDRERRKFFSEFDLSGLVADVADLYAPTAEEHRLRVRVSTGPELNVFGDKQLLAQALANLLDNAIRYAQPDSDIEIEARQETDGITVQIANSVASGTPPGHDHSGNGLGLPIARAIAQLHHGQLTLDASAGRFTARLIFPPSIGRR